jgi:hypothetical protein
MLIHPVFNVDQLYLANNNLLLGQVQEPPLPVFIDGSPEYNAAKVLDCYYRSKRYQYLVCWTGYNDLTFEPA